MRALSRSTWLAGLLLGAALALALTLGASGAQLPQEGNDVCIGDGRLCGGLSAIGGRSAGNGAYRSLDGARVPAAGQLAYADFLAIEQEARSLLLSSKQFRQDISPHQEKPDFDTLVRQFDYQSGFDRTIPGETITLAQRIDQADADLRKARDLYGFLAVYADQGRMRQDLAGQGRCPAQPLADDPVASPPVVDMCNFAARLRESVREVAYLRMIFGQQFTADALGLHFSGNEIVGGDAFVQDEVDKLQLAVGQYDQAQAALAEGLALALGNGCYVSDFYAQPEWALLSRAVDGQERAQHEIAVRKSYLDGYGMPAAQADYRDAAVNQYVQLLGTAGLASRPAGERCQQGTRPDGQMLAEMAINLQETASQSRTLEEGRNIFGLDVTFTPARPFRTAAAGSNDTGLFEQALAAANRAKELHDDEEAATREFDMKAQKLLDEIEETTRFYDHQISNLSSCSSLALPDDAEFFACVQTQIDLLTACDIETGDQAAFDACANDPAVQPGSAMKQALEQARVAWLQAKRVEQELHNLPRRQEIETNRNATVTHQILTGGIAQSILDFTEAMADCCVIEAGPTGGLQYNPGTPVIAAVRAASTLRQAFQDIAIEDANSEAVVKNLLLDMAEVQIDLQVAAQAYKSALTEFQGTVGELQDYVLEAQRARAYVESSPANDPSYRLVRDSARLQLADKLAEAARVSYLAARRAEYEYADRLSASNFRMSDIYRARTADDILQFLDDLEDITSSWVVQDAEISQEDFTVSVALHVLGLTDESLGLSGDAAQAERVRRFRLWVAENTVIASNGKPVLAFSFTTNIGDEGVFANVIQEAYERFWLHKIAGINQPRRNNTGLGLNLLTDQPGLNYRRVIVTQSGLTHLRSRGGCIFEYRLIHPAALLGYGWPSNQDPEQASFDFKAAVNGANGENTPGFLGRPVSATEWQIEILAGSPEPVMDLQQLTDIELFFSTTRGSRTCSGCEPGEPPPTPPPSECVRVDR